MEECFHRKHINNKVALLQKVIGTYVYSIGPTVKWEKWWRTETKNEGRKEEKIKRENQNPQTPPVPTGAKVLLVLKLGHPPFFFFWGGGIILPALPLNNNHNKGFQERKLQGCQIDGGGGIRATFLNFAPGCQNSWLTRLPGVQPPGYTPAWNQ